MKKILPAFIFASLLGFNLSVVHADPPVPPFYAAAMKMAPEGKLGQVIKQEKIVVMANYADPV